MERLHFATWAEQYSQKTNRSLAGSRLRVADGMLEDSERLIAQDWGMVVSSDSPNGDVRNSGDTAARFMIDATVPVGDVADARELSGAEAVDFAQEHMPVLDALMRDARERVDFTGISIAVCLILEPKTAVLLRQLKAAGAKVGAYCGAEANDERVAEQLRSEGIAVAFNPDWTPAQAHQGALDLLDELKPNIIIDDGASFARLAAMERPELMANIIGVAEETTSGVRAFQAMQDAGALSFPVIAVNDSMLKTGFDNAHGTGETCVTTMQRILGADVFAGAKVTVVGYGPVGRGFAHRVRALGADVTICDIDPVVSLQAVFDGFRALDIDDALGSADMVISATGVRHTITLQHMQAMKPQAVLSVIGGIANEIALNEIEDFHAEIKREIRDLSVLNGPVIRLVSEGDGVNYTVGGGNPIEIMDLSFAVQASAVTYLLEHHGALPHGLQRLDRSVDRHIANIALQVRGYRASHAVADNGYDWTLTRFAENEAADGKE